MPGAPSSFLFLNSVPNPPKKVALVGPTSCEIVDACRQRSPDGWPLVEMRGVGTQIELSQMV